MAVVFRLVSMNSKKSKIVNGPTAFALTAATTNWFIHELETRQLCFLNHNDLTNTLLQVFIHMIFQVIITEMSTPIRREHAEMAIVSTRRRLSRFFPVTTGCIPVTTGIVTPNSAGTVISSVLCFAMYVAGRYIHQCWGNRS